MMGFAYLTRYYLKRTLRHRAMAVITLALPLFGGLLRLLIHGEQAGRLCAWLCPVACALLVAGWICLLGEMDRISGLSDGIRSTPLSCEAIIASRVVTGITMFGAQMLLFMGILVLPL